MEGSNKKRLLTRPYTYFLNSPHMDLKTLMSTFCSYYYYIGQSDSFHQMFEGMYNYDKNQRIMIGRKYKVVFRYLNNKKIDVWIFKERILLTWVFAWYSLRFSIFSFQCLIRKWIEDCQEHLHVKVWQPDIHGVKWHLKYT